MSGKHLTLDEKNEIVQLFESNTSVTTLAERFGRNPEKINEILRQFGIHQKRGPIDITTQDQIARAYELGDGNNDWPIQRIADTFGVKLVTVEEIVHVRRKMPKRRRARTLTQKQKDAIIQKYDRGISAKIISVEIDYHINTVQRILRESGRTRKPPWPQDGCTRNETNDGYVTTHRGREHTRMWDLFFPNQLIPKKGMTIHHKDLDKLNNKIENLELWVSRHPARARQIELPPDMAGILLKTVDNLSRIDADKEASMFLNMDSPAQALRLIELREGRRGPFASHSVSSIRPHARRRP